MTDALWTASHPSQIGCHRLLKMEAVVWNKL